MIKDFGGNPSRVTIFGESAGGGSTSLLSVISEAENLFAQSIPMSGSVVSAWALNDNVVLHSKKLNKASHCNGSSKEIKKCLKKKTSQEFIDAQKAFVVEFIPGDEMIPTTFNPRKDGELVEKNLDFDQVYDSRKKKPTFIGICSMEDVLFGEVAFLFYYMTLIFSNQKSIYQINGQILAYGCRSCCSLQ